MKLRTMIAIIACKMTRFILRVTGHGGTNLPGKVAVKLYPTLLNQLAQHVTTIIVTGTNGKTTTSRMVEQCLKDANLSYFANKSGANLLTGITAEFAVHATNTGKSKYTHALIECDEAAFKQVSRYVDAKFVVVTNVFRDQLDRYGELSTTLTSIGIGIDHSPSAIVCLNADDSLSVSLAGRIKNKIIYYGVDTEIYQDRVEEVSDAPYCIQCGHEYTYDYVTYGHLGSYRCEACGYSRPQPEVAVTQLLQTTPDSSLVEMKLGTQKYQIKINLPGGYNIYNAAACAAVGSALGLSPELVVKALGHFGGGFGRMEKFTIEGVDIRMILIKNPAGCNQVLNFLSNNEIPSLFVVALNDKTADGTDISWIWDVDFEKLIAGSRRITEVIVTGIRADDMALRFKYTGIQPQKLRIIKDYDQLLQEMLEQEAPVYIMPTYTAMLDLRAKISKNYGFKEFWES